MTTSGIETRLQLRSLVSSSGELELSLTEVPVPQPGPDERAVVTASIPAGLMKAMAGRVDQSLPVGNEGAGVVAARRARST